jgi:O-antigen ligase
MTRRRGRVRDRGTVDPAAGPIIAAVNADTAVESAGSPAGQDVAHGSGLEERVLSLALALLPGGLVVYFGFEAGGYFPGPIALGTLAVLQILVLRIVAVERPFAGVSRSHAAVLGVFAAYTGWTLLSAVWSHAEGRALVEFDRSLLYLCLLLVGGLVPRSRWRVRWMARGLAGGALLVCAVGLITRLLPDVWPTGPSVANSRLSYPITYWNALGVLAAIATLMLAGLASDPSERRAVRTVAAAGIPIAATTLLLTFSRGSILALGVGLVVFLVVAQTRELLGAIVAVVPATAVALVVTYNAKLLASNDPTTSAATAQGHHVALVLAGAVLVAAALRWALDPLDRRFGSQPGRLARSAGRGMALTAGAAAFVAVVALAAGGAHLLSKGYREFVSSAPLRPTQYYTHRLGTANSNGRIELWRDAVKEFSAAPLIGSGAGTYTYAFYRYHRSIAGTYVNAHSLYLQTLGELGLAGMALLGVSLLAILAALARRIRGPDRVIYAGFFAAAIAWALHSAQDWDWQMPVVTAWPFYVGGAALARQRMTAPPSANLVTRRVRAALSAAIAVVAVIPALLLLSQDHLQSAASAFQAGNCVQTQHEAQASIDVLGLRPEPYQLIAYCDMAAGRAREAVGAMRQAVARERGNWQYHYGLAIAESLAGQNPRPELAVAVRLDPGGPVLNPMLPVLRTRSRSRWLHAAVHAETAMVTSGNLALR